MPVGSATVTVGDGSVYETVTVSFGTTSTITIGQTTPASAGDSGFGNFLTANQVSLPQQATIQNLSFYVPSAAGKLVLGIYDATGTSGNPGNLLAVTGEMTTVLGWNTANVITPVQLNAGTYWLAFFPSSNAMGVRKIAGGGVGRFSSLLYSGTMPSRFPTNPSTSTSYWTINATLSTQNPVIPVPFYTGPFNVTGGGTTSVASFFPADIIRSVTSHSTGSWYFEVTVNAATNPAQVGVGIDNNLESLTIEGGQAGSICWLGNGNVNYNGTLNAYQAASFSVGDVLGINVDLTGKTIQFRVNGNSFSSNFSISAITGPSMFALGMLTNPGDQITANFTGVSPAFSFSAPSTAWG